MTLVLHSILPAAILIAFGFVLGELGFFDKTATAPLIRFSVRIVVPVAIFVQALGTPRLQLSDYAYIGALTIAFIVIYIVWFAVGKVALGNAGATASSRPFVLAAPTWRRWACRSIRGSSVKIWRR